MDLRSESHFSTDQSVKVTILGEPEMTLPGRLVDASGKRIRLLTSTGAPAGAAVRVDIEETMLLGEVCYCRQAGSEYAIVLQLEQALTLTEELSRLMRHLLDDSDASRDRLRRTHDVAASPRRQTTKQHRK